MEYNRAVERDIPRLIFMIDENHPVKRSDVETGIGADKLQALKERIGTARVRATFTTPEDLHGKVILALNELKNIPPRKPKHPANKFYPENFPSVTRFFTGRENVLEGLQKTLKEKCRASLHGTWGLGKTSVVLEYAHRNQEIYEKIFYVRATREETVSNMAQIAETLMPELKEVAEIELKAQKLKAWLDVNKNWLLIFDNAEELESLKSYIPNTKSEHILFASNLRQIKTFGEEVEIDLIEPEDARNLLYHRAKESLEAKVEDASQEEQKVIEEITDELGRLPLAINIAGAYIAKRQISFAKYLERFKQTAEKLLAEQDDFDNYLNKSVAIAFTTAYDELRKPDDDTEEAKLTAQAVEIILKSLVFLSPEAIPEKLLQGILAEQNETFARMAEDEELWEQVRVKLTKYDLLEYDSEANAFETHRLVQRVVENKLNDEEKKELLQNVVLVLKRLFPKVEHTTWAECGKYSPHIEISVKFAKKMEVETDDIAFICNQVGYYLDDLAQYQQAEYFYTFALAIREKVLGAEHPYTAGSLNNLAGLYESQGRYEKALPLYERALAIYEKALGAEHPFTATSLNNLAYLYYSQGRYEDALPLYKRALAIFQKALGENHPRAKIVAGNLLRCKEEMKNKG